MQKTCKQLERYFKGVANHRRIEILYLVKQTNSITLVQIASQLRCNFKTISEHTRKLTQAGLLNKRYKGREVFHSLSPYGKKFLEFTKSF
ncbi:MAG: winged helix-turn-helix domain-containing protein [Candidatus Doudnabacteria bacterium]|jgi:DNA-binding transcriptional ArsR family regulator